MSEYSGTVANDPEITLLEELRPTAEALFDRHLRNTKTWYPHELIPYDMARDFKRDVAWDPNEYPLSEGIRSAIFVNLLTEDNLPYYTHVILNSLRKTPGHPLEAWTMRWTAEEARHSSVIGKWVEVTRALDPRMLQDARMVQMSTGQVPQPPTFADSIAYVPFQELATWVAHRNTGAKLDKEHGGKRVMATVAGDELLHHNFYRDLAGEALAINPTVMLQAIYRQLRNFAMPGTGIPDFDLHTDQIIQAGIYDLQKFKDDVVLPTLGHWGIEGLTGLPDEAQKMQEKIIKFVGILGRAVTAQQVKYGLQIA